MSYRLVMFKQTIGPKLGRLHKLGPSGENVTFGNETAGKAN